RGRGGVAQGRQGGERGRGAGGELGLRRLAEAFGERLGALGFRRAGAGLGRGGRRLAGFAARGARLGGRVGNTLPGCVTGRAGHETSICACGSAVATGKALPTERYNWRAESLPDRAGRLTNKNRETPMLRKIL